jgi:hypothetical protein
MRHMRECKQVFGSVFRGKESDPSILVLNFRLKPSDFMFQAHYKSSFYGFLLQFIPVKRNMG